MRSIVLRIAILVLGLDVRGAWAGGVLLLSSGDLPPYVATAEGFRTAYRGATKQVRFETRDSVTTRQTIAEADPEVIVALGAAAARFAHERFPRVPLIHALVLDPVSHGIEGARVTGVSNRVSDRDQIEALRRAAPGVRTVARVRSSEAAPALVRDARQASAAAGIQFVDLPIAAPGEISAAIRQVAARTDAIWLPADPALATPEVFQFMLQWSLEQRRPLLVFSEALVRSGALVSVAPDYAWIGARAADLVRRVRSGERPGDIPPITLTRTRVVANLATARAIGLDADRFADMEHVSDATPEGAR